MRKLDLRVPSFGSWLTIASPTVAEVMAEAGFDWLAVDMEHSVISYETAQQMIQVVAAHGVVPFVRVPKNDAVYIKWAMDAGAFGVIVPMVNSAQEAAAAVAAVQYPPLGTRGVGLARAQGYGQAFEAYRDALPHAATVIVQIEHIDAVRNIDAILQTPGVDGFLVGPYDLSGSLGMPGAFDHPEVASALARVDAAAKRLGVPAGFHVIQPDADAVNKRLRAGCTFIALSLDILYLGTGCRSLVARARDLASQHAAQTVTA